MATAYDLLDEGAKLEFDDIVDKADMMSNSDFQAVVEAIAMRQFAGGPMSPRGIELDEQARAMVEKKHGFRP
jgi:hypothetical protein